MMLDFLSRLGSVILIRNALVWTCQETSKSCQHLPNFETTREDRANSGRTNESSRFPWNFSNIGGGLQTLDHLPISRCQLWNFQDGLTGPSTLRSLNIIRKWLGILGAFWSLLEPWRMSACDYQVYIGTDQQVNRYINSSSLQRLIDNEEWVPFASFFVRWVQDGSLLLSSLRFQPPTSRWIDNRCMFISCLAEEEWIWQSELRQSELGPDLDYNGRSHRVLEEAIDLAVSRIL